MLPDPSRSIILKNEGWSNHGGVWARGWAYGRAGIIVRGNELARHIADSDVAFSELIPLLGGNFSAVSQTNDALLLAVDRIRSIPLFYAKAPDGLWAIGDCARTVAREAGSCGMNPVGAIELMLQGCVSGSKTLMDGLQQVRPGEIVRIENGDAVCSRYFRYGEGSPFIKTEAVLVDEAAELLAAAFDHCINSLDGRPAIVPLSGGFDSRLIVARLAAAGKSETICFTYGPPFGKDVRLSKRVADMLGMAWHRIPYTADKWTTWAAGSSFQQFQREATGLASIEHEQDWPAVLELKSQNIAQSDAVFIPGHAGDFLGGSHLAIEPNQAEQDATESILNAYYNEWPRNRIPASYQAELRQRIEEQIDGFKNPIDAFTTFGWQERQAKLIANSVRVYEHHGFDWALPYWSHPPLLDFWGRVPVAYRRGSRLYQQAVRKLLGDDLARLPTAGHPRTRFSSRVSRVLDGGLGRYGIWAGSHPVRAAMRTRIRDLVQIGDPTISEAIEPLLRSVASLPIQRVSINALLALGQLNRISNESI